MENEKLYTLESKKDSYVFKEVRMNENGVEVTKSKSSAMGQFIKKTANFSLDIMSSEKKRQPLLYSVLGLISFAAFLTIASGLRKIVNSNVIFLQSEVIEMEDSDQIISAVSRLYGKDLSLDILLLATTAICTFLLFNMARNFGVKCARREYEIAKFEKLRKNV